MATLAPRRASRSVLLAALALTALSVAAPAAAAQATPPANTVSDGTGYKPAPGYVWVAPDTAGDFRVKWKPGTAHPDHKNVLAAAGERKWDPAPGFKWKTADNNDLRVEWNPGSRHPQFAGVVAGPAEGKWNTAPGFKWLNDTPGDLRAVAAGGAAAGGWDFGSSSSGYTPGGAAGGAAAGPAPKDIERAVGKVIAAGLANVLAQQDDEGDIGRALLIGLARKARDELIHSALADAFPNLPAADRRTLGNAAGLALDGRLTTGNLRGAQAKDALKDWLKKQNPDMTNVVEAADLLYGIIQRR